VRRFLERLAEARTAFGGVLHNRALRRLELAWACSIVGAWAYGVAVVVYAFEQGGARAVGIVGLLRWGTAALASPFAAVGDRASGAPRRGGIGPLRAGLIVAAAAAVFKTPVLVRVPARGPRRRGNAPAAEARTAGSPGLES
jgi:hypothetical protein